MEQQAQEVFEPPTAPALWRPGGLATKAEESSLGRAATVQGPDPCYLAVIGAALQAAILQNFRHQATG